MNTYCTLHLQIYEIMSFPSAKWICIWLMELSEMKTKSFNPNNQVPPTAILESCYRKPYLQFIIKIKRWIQKKQRWTWGGSASPPSTCLCLEFTPFQSLQLIKFNLGQVSKLSIWEKKQKLNSNFNLKVIKWCNSTKAWVSNNHF